jgi:cell division protein FtsB
MRINWLGTVLFMIGSLTLFSVSLFSESGLQRVEGLKQALHQQESKNQELSARIHSLKSEIVGIQTDDRTLERIARERLVLAKPDEAIVFFNNTSR